jgi:hypothetical protein
MLVHEFRQQAYLCPVSARDVDMDLVGEGTRAYTHICDVVNQCKDAPLSIRSKQRCRIDNYAHNHACIYTSEATAAFSDTCTMFIFTFDAVAVINGYDNPNPTYPKRSTPMQPCQKHMYCTLEMSRKP